MITDRTGSSVVIIGGGVMGTSTAYHLARAGVTDVVLLEAAELGSGSSGKPLGGVRALFSDPANIALGARSLAAFRRFPSELGVDIGLRRVGYLLVIRDGRDIGGFEQGVALQNAMGVSSRLITPAEAADLCPHLTVDDVVAAVWSPDDGYARPAPVVLGYARAAEALGVSVRTGIEVAGISAVGGGRALVQTSDGAYETGTVICTAGAWSARIGTMVGVDLPITPLRRQIAFTPPLQSAPQRVPFTIDYSTTAYFHGSEDGGLLMGWADPRQSPGFGRESSTGWHDGLRLALRRFAPEVAELPLHGGWAGLYEMTPDCNAIIGESEVGFRFLYAAGFSGHGFLQGPAVGDALCDLYRNRTPAVDVSAFALERFTRRVTRTELGII